MADTTHASPVAVSYAKALLELAGDQNKADAIGGELAELQKIAASDPAFGLFLADPSVSNAERGKILKTALGSQISPLLMSFVGLLNEKNRLNLINEIAESYAHQLDKKHGKVEVGVTVAHKLDAAQLEQVRQSVSKALGREAIVHEHVDERIIGGLVLRVHDKLIDGSVKAQLELMKDKLMAAAPR